MKALIILIKIMAISLLGFTLPGCSGSGDIADLQVKMNEIKARPRGRIPPPPEFIPLAPVSYSQHQNRSPFTPPSDQRQLELTGDRTVVPDMTRPKEYLERFSLESLSMVGTITKPEQPLEALIQDPNGVVNRIRVGGYMGKNFGRVVEVSEISLSLIEIVPDGPDAWVERPRTIRIQD
jgi:type IV pilus assembly protein PilP